MLLSPFEHLLEKQNSLKLSFINNGALFILDAHRFLFSFTAESKSRKFKSGVENKILSHKSTLTLMLQSFLK